MKKTVIIVAAAVVAVVTLIIFISVESLRKKPASSAYDLGPIQNQVMSVGSTMQVPIMHRNHSKNQLLIKFQEKKLREATYETSDPTIVNVTEQGLVEAISDGTATITVHVDDLQRSFQVESYYALEQITCTANDLFLKPGQKEQLIVTYHPEKASRYGKLSFGSYNPSVVSVDDDGMLTAHELGSAIIEVTCDHFVCQVEIGVFQPIEGINVTAKKETFVQGETFVFITDYIPRTVSEPEPIIYSVSENLGTITSDGRFTASGLGDGILTVSCDDFVIEIPIHVGIPLTGISVSQQNIHLDPPATSKFPLVLSPANATDYPTITYHSSNPQVATVSPDGTVSAVGSGSCTITAVCGAFSASVVYNCSTPLDSVTLPTANLCLGIGSTFQITPSFAPAGATHGAVTWIVEKPEVCSVVNGKITGLSAGSTAVAVNCDGKSALMSVFVQSALTSAGQAAADKVITFAKQYIGTPYVYGGTSLTGGIDCSSFTQQCYAQAGYTLPRVSYAQATVGRLVCMDPDAWLPGDLLFFESGGKISHVGIYIGGGQMIHANESLTNSVAISATSYTSSKGLVTPCTVRRVFK